MSHPKEPSSKVAGAQALLRGLDLLMTIGSSETPLKFTDLQKQLAIPKASLHRLLSALQSRQLVRQDVRSKEYSVGSKVLDLARRTLDQSSVIRSCKPELSRLARELNCPVCLYILDGEEVFVLDFEDPDASQSRVVRPWPRLSINNSAAATAILAGLEAQQRELQYPSLDQATQSSISLTRAIGYAIDHSDSEATIAAAVTEGSDYPVAAICCQYNIAQAPPEKLHQLGRLILDSARRASGNVGINDSQNALISDAKKPVAPVTFYPELGRDFMGENPLWCAQSQRLYWLDILAPALRFLEPESGITQRFELPDLFGGFALQSPEILMLVGRRGLYRYALGAGQPQLLIDPESTKKDNRFNTAAIDTEGNLWAGTMSVDNSAGVGSLYKINDQLLIDCAMPKVHAPKNVAWSPDNSLMYFTEGKRSTLYAYRRKSLSRASRKVIVTSSAEHGSPNGIAVDVEGGIWVAMFGGWAIHRYLADGTLDQVINLPIPMPTNLCFGGKDYRTLFITSTYLRVPPGVLSKASQSGTLLSIQTQVPGLPARYFGSGKAVNER